KDSRAVADHLHGLGYLTVRAESKGGDAWLPTIRERLSSGSSQLTTGELAFLTQELATMLQAGLSLEKALTILLVVNKKTQTGAFLNRVLKRVRGGASFGKALTAEQEVLPKAYVGMVRAGEAGGGRMLEDSLEHLADFLYRTQAVQDSIASALLYPMILVVMA